MEVNHHCKTSIARPSRYPRLIIQHKIIFPSSTYLRLIAFRVDVVENQRANSEL